jgi:transketolase
MVTQAKSGHPGGSLSSADFLTALYFNVMDQDPSKWTRDGKDQDMFFLSAGHLTPVYYSILARAGYFPVSELATFRKFGTRLQGHPSIQKGFLASSRLLARWSGSRRYGAALSKKLDKDPHTVFVMCGDGESEEGQIWEAAMFAPHHKVDNLIAMTDWNHKQIDGDTEDVAD